ncbi:Outer membrane efflux protein [compost metagenome]
MSFFRKGLLILLFSSYVVGINAQTKQGTLSLNTLIDQVSTHAPSLMADSSAIMVSKAEAGEAVYNWLPNLKLNYQADLGTNNNVAGPYFGFGVIPSNSRGVRENNNYNAALTNLGIVALDWEVYNFGAYAAANKVAKSKILMSQKSFEWSKFQLQNLGVSGYLQLLQYRDLLRIQSSAIDRNRDIERSILALAKSGVRAGVDTSIAQAELSKSRLDYIELSNDYKQLQLKLAYLSGLPLASIAPDTLVQEKLIKDGIAVVARHSMDLSNPLVELQESVYQNSLDKETAVKKGYAPKISLQAAAWGRGSNITSNDEFQNLSEGWGFDRSNYLVGLGISYNLSDLKRRQLKLRSQKAATAYELSRLKAQRQELLLQSKQAYAELNTALERLREIPRQLVAAQAGYRQKLALYKNGLTNIIELNAALAVLYRAERDFVMAKNGFCTALMQCAMGTNQLNQILNLLR